MGSCCLVPWWTSEEMSRGTSEQGHQSTGRLGHMALPPFLSSLIDWGYLSGQRLLCIIGPVLLSDGHSSVAQKEAQCSILAAHVPCGALVMVR